MSLGRGERVKLASLDAIRGVFSGDTALPPDDRDEETSPAS
jgi:hypothetical protein